MPKIVELDDHTYKMLLRLTKLSENTNFLLEVDTDTLSNAQWWNTANLSDFDRIEFDLTQLRKSLQSAV